MARTTARTSLETKLHGVVRHLLLSSAGFSHVLPAVLIRSSLLSWRFLSLFRQEFYADVRDVDRNNEVLRIIGAFRLNGFEQLGLPFDATPEDIRKAYRKLSLLVHPDKCSHPQAKAAFEIVNAASKQLQDDDRRREIVHVLNLSRGEHLAAQQMRIVWCML